MLAAMRLFIQGLLSFHPFWRVWVATLLVANMILPLYFIGSVEGKVVLGCMLLGAMLQILIVQRLGFVRLVGIGHVVWIPMIWWLASRLEALQPGTLFHGWILTTIALDTISLALDTIDVTRWLRGERDATFTVEAA